MTLEQIVCELLRQRVTLRELVNAYLRKLLFHYEHQTQIADHLGVSRQQVAYRMRRLGLTCEELREWRERQMKLKS